MSAHTPGPWSIGNRQNVVVDASGIILANCEYSHSAKNRRKPSGDQSKANARLIVAAPELLAALSLILDSATDGRSVPEWLAERLIVVRAAIAKAEGR